MMRHFLMKYWLLILFIITTMVLGHFIARNIRQADMQQSNNEEWKATVQVAIDRYIGKPLNLPYVDSLHVSESEYLAMCTLPLKIVNFLDGDCSTCLMKIHFWEEFVSELNAKRHINIPVMMYAYSYFEDNIRDYMNKEWDNRPWQFDKNRYFIERNELYDLRLQTVLLDSENRVILIGDPLLNPKLRKLYMKTIISLL